MPRDPVAGTFLNHHEDDCVAENFQAYRAMRRASMLAPQRAEHSEL